MKKILLLLLFFPVFAFSLNCGSCGLEVKGQFWKGKGAYGEYVYCDKCYKTLGKCSICKRPAANLIYDGKIFVCPDCQATLPKCSGCGALINGQAWKMPSNGKVFCEKCHSTGDVCDVCGAPVP
ncbi:MAG: hypothetical protein WCK36_04060, partial [Candidatus Firestonebacteria bacterium]